MEQKKKTVSTAVLPGFMELLPADQIVFDRMKYTIREVFERFGFAPLDTPVIERAEVLAAKAGGETEKQIYQFKKGDNDLALRFDLTVPLARYVSEHYRELVFPFRRYHIGKVYRGESPQKGRFREFYQCDIDIVGNGTLSLVNDAEILSVINAVFVELNLGSFIVGVNNRKIMTGFLESLGVLKIATNILRTIDKLEKVGMESVKTSLMEFGVSESGVLEIFRFLNIHGTNIEVLKQLGNLGVKNKVFASGVEELSGLVKYLGELGVPQENYKIDLSIARGLDYYTGTVYETKLVDYPQIGSICSGGRYDNLAEMYTDKKLPGVGISIGLTRLFSQLKEARLIKAGAETSTRVLVVPLISDMTWPLAIASQLRKEGIATQVYLEEAKMKTKLDYANKLGIPNVLIVGEDEIASSKYTLKNMQSGEQIAVAPKDIKSNLA